MSEASENSSPKHIESVESRPQLRAEFQRSFQERSEKIEQRCESRTFKVTELDAPTQKNRLTHEELDFIDDQRRAEGKKLAGLIYELTNEKRESNLEVYVKAINDVVLHLDSDANQSILETACSYFELNFGPTLKAKGYSPQMIDAIVHRTGRQTRKLLEKIIRGFDVHQIATTIWNYYSANDLKIKERTLTYMQELTHNQVRELREEYNTIPSKTLAKLLHDALHRTNLDGKPYPDIDLIHYILCGRSKHEIEQIEFQFNEHYHYLRFGEGEKNLREQIDKIIPSSQVSAVKELLEGFNSKSLAEKIFSMLQNSVNVGEPELSHSLHPDFAGKFRKSYVDAENWQKELRARDAINELLNYCTPQQFEEVNKQLHNTYNLKLHSYWYKCNQNKCLRLIALDLAQGLQEVTPRRECNRDEDYLSDDILHEVKDDFRLSTNKEIKDVIKIHAEEVIARECEYKVKQGLSALRFLSPEEVFQVKDYFISLTGIELEDFVKKHIGRICRNEEHQYVTFYQDLMFSGMGRLCLKADLFDLFQSREQRISGRMINNLKNQYREQSIDICEKIKRVLRRNQSSEQKSEAVIELLTYLDNQALPIVEAVFLELSSGTTSLRSYIHNELATSDAQIVEAVLCGYNIKSLVTRIKQQPEQLFEVALARPWVISLVESEFKKNFNLELEEHCRTTLNSKPKLLVHVLAILLSTKAEVLWKLFSTTEPLSQEEVDQCIHTLKLKAAEIIALEAAYNRNFSCFHYCYQKNYGTLLQRLRVLGSLGLLPRIAFSEAILLLEGLKYDITTNLKKLLSKTDIELEPLSQVESILHENRDSLSTIKKSYNALDEEQTLRESIYALKLPLRIKNRVILALDGFHPAAVAMEINSKIEHLSGPALTEQLHTILAPSTQECKNPRIPSNPNWTDEMYNQIRLAYEGLYQNKLIGVLRTKGVPLKGRGLNLLCFRLYGEISKKVIDLRRILKALELQESQIHTNKLQQVLLQLLNSTTPALRERLFDMYEAYYGQSDSQLSIQDSFSQTISSEKVLDAIRDLIDETEVWDQPEKASEIEPEVENLDNLLEQLQAIA